MTVTAWSQAIKDVIGPTEDIPGKSECLCRSTICILVTFFNTAPRCQMVIMLLNQANTMLGPTETGSNHDH